MQIHRQTDIRDSCTDWQKEKEQQKKAVTSNIPLLSHSQGIQHWKTQTLSSNATAPAKGLLKCFSAARANWGSNTKNCNNINKNNSNSCSHNAILITCLRTSHWNYLPLAFGKCSPSTCMLCKEQSRAITVTFIAQQRQWHSTRPTLWAGSAWRVERGGRRGGYSVVWQPCRLPQSMSFIFWFVAKRSKTNHLLERSRWREREGEGGR